MVTTKSKILRKNQRKLFKMKKLHKKCKGEKMSEQKLLFEKKEKEFVSWDFKEADVKEFTHCMHTYPAVMIPQIARRLIHLYGKNAKNILDPFMGTGTSLVEASLTPQIEEAYGFDLNPLALLISKVKTTSISINVLKDNLDNIIKSKEYYSLPNFKNIDFWFKKEIIEKLAIIKTAINKIEDINVKNFFLVVFSETVRNVSNTRSSEFKLYRMTKEKIDKHNPDVFEEFNKIAIRNINGMSEYIPVKNHTKVNTLLLSSTDTLPIKENSINLLVTSPPYGDSRTTVAYGQFSRLALQWLGYDNANIIDKSLLGGIPSKNIGVYINSQTLEEVISTISQIDPNRAKEVLSFFEDFDKCVMQINRVMAKDSYICFVVGNRTVKGINIPTDKIMTEMFMDVDNYEHIITYTRNIPNKRMPKVNSPSNKKGENGSTMTKEFIFVLHKI